MSWITPTDALLRCTEACAKSIVPVEEWLANYRTAKADDAAIESVCGVQSCVWRQERFVPTHVVRYVAARHELSLRDFLVQLEPPHPKFIFLPPRSDVSSGERLRTRKAVAAINQASEIDLSVDRQGASTVCSAHPVSRETLRAVHLGGQKVCAVRRWRRTVPFVKELGIAMDMRSMSIAGGVIGYYIGYVRSWETEHSIIAAAVCMILFMLVDAVLLLIMLSKEDDQTS